MGRANALEDLADVADAVGVRVGLGGVGHVRAVILTIRDAIAVRIHGGLADQEIPTRTIRVGHDLRVVPRDAIAEEAVDREADERVTGLPARHVSVAAREPVAVGLPEVEPAATFVREQNPRDGGETPLDRDLGVAAALVGVDETFEKRDPSLGRHGDLEDPHVVLRLAGVAGAVAVRVGLVRVGDVGTVVVPVHDAVAVPIVRDGLARIALAVTIGVGLVRVGHGRAVVVRVGHPVTVGVDDGRLAGVALAVLVRVGLVGVGHVRAVVLTVRDAITVRIHHRRLAGAVHAELPIGALREANAAHGGVGVDVAARAGAEVVRVIEGAAELADRARGFTEVALHTGALAGVGDQLIVQAGAGTIALVDDPVEVAVHPVAAEPLVGGTLLLATEFVLVRPADAELLTHGHVAAVSVDVPVQVRAAVSRAIAFFLTPGAVVVEDGVGAAAGEAAGPVVQADLVEGTLVVLRALVGTRAVDAPEGARLGGSLLDVGTGGCAVVAGGAGPGRVGSDDGVDVTEGRGRGVARGLVGHVLADRGAVSDGAGTGLLVTRDPAGVQVALVGRRGVARHHVGGVLAGGGALVIADAEACLLVGGEAHGVVGALVGRSRVAHLIGAGVGVADPTSAPEGTLLRHDGLIGAPGPVDILARADLAVGENGGAVRVAAGTHRLVAQLHVGGILAAGGPVDHHALTDEVVAGDTAGVVGADVGRSRVARDAVAGVGVASPIGAAPLAGIVGLDFVVAAHGRAVVADGAGALGCGGDDEVVGAAGGGRGVTSDALAGVGLGNEAGGLVVDQATAVLAELVVEGDGAHEVVVAGRRVHGNQLVVLTARRGGLVDAVLVGGAAIRGIEAPLRRAAADEVVRAKRVQGLVHPAVAVVVDPVAELLRTLVDASGATGGLLAAVVDRDALALRAVVRRVRGAVLLVRRGQRRRRLPSRLEALAAAATECNETTEQEHAGHEAGVRAGVGAHATIPPGWF